MEAIGKADGVSRSFVTPKLFLLHMSLFLCIWFLQSHLSNQPIKEVLGLFILLFSSG